MREREPEDRVTVVKTGGGSGGVIAGVLLGAVAVVVIIYLVMGGVFTDGSGTSDVNVDMPDVDVEAPDAPEGGGETDAAPEGESEAAPAE